MSSESPRSGRRSTASPPIAAVGSPDTSAGTVARAELQMNGNLAGVILRAVTARLQKEQATMTPFDQVGMISPATLRAAAGSYTRSLTKDPRVNHPEISEGTTAEGIIDKQTPEGRLMIFYVPGSYLQMALFGEGENEYARVSSTFSLREPSTFINTTSFVDNTSLTPRVHGRFDNDLPVEDDEFRHVAKGVLWLLSNLLNWNETDKDGKPIVIMPRDLDTHAVSSSAPKELP